MIIYSAIPKDHAQISILYAIEKSQKPYISMAIKPIFSSNNFLAIKKIKILQKIIDKVTAINTPNLLDTPQIKEAIAEYICIITKLEYCPKHSLSTTAPLLIISSTKSLSHQGSTPIIPL